LLILRHFIDSRQYTTVPYFFTLDSVYIIYYNFYYGNTTSSSSSLSFIIIHKNVSGLQHRLAMNGRWHA